MPKLSTDFPRGVSGEEIADRTHSHAANVNADQPPASVDVVGSDEVVGSDDVSSTAVVSPDVVMDDSGVSDEIAISDDIKDLCRFTALGSSQYRTFDGVGKGLDEVADFDSVTLAKPQPKARHLENLGNTGSNGTDSVVLESVPEATVATSISVAPVVSSQYVSSENMEPAPVPDLVVMAASGGVGVSTIAATLAQLWAEDGKPVDLADAAEPSLLPLHLGGNGCVEGVWSLRQRNAGTIRVIAPYADAGDKLDSESVIVLDAGTLPESETDRLAKQGATFLVVATRELPSEVRLPAIVSRLRSAGAEVKILLNQSGTDDESKADAVSFHRSLKQRVGEGLLPVTIRHHGLVPKALAAGKTVVEYAPDSEVAADFRAVAEWLGPVASGRKHAK